MSGQVVQQSVAADLVTTLSTTAGAAATGLIYSDVTCSYAKEGQIGFTSKTLTALNFIEIGSGVYTIEFTASELNTVGAFIWIVTGATIQQFVGVATVSSTALGASTQTTINTCVVTGHILDLEGDPVVGTYITAHLVGTPTLMGSVGISAESSSVKTDTNGQFFIELPRLTTVEVFIPIINYKRQFTVPNSATANLFTGIP